MDFFQQLERDDLPRVTHPSIQRDRRLATRLLSKYLKLFSKGLSPMKPIALVNDMPAYDLTQPPMHSEAGARVLKVGFEYVVLKRKARPINLVLMLNSACNMNCRHCSAKHYMTQNAKPLAFEEVKDLVDQFVDLGGSSLIYSGGEPTLHPKLLELVDYVPKEKSTIAMFTNGTRLPEMADELKSAGIFGTLVSLDSHIPEKHDKYRGSPGAFKQAMAGIEALKERNMLTGISTYITRDDLEAGDFDAIVKLGTDVGAHQVFVFDAVPTGAMRKEHKLVLRPEDRAELKRLTMAQNANPEGPAIMGQSWVNSAEGFGCFAGFYQLYITACGDVAPCDFTPITFGNIREEKLEVIWDRMRASEDWGIRHMECRMQDPEFRAKTIDFIPEDAPLPVPYEKILEWRREKT